MISDLAEPPNPAEVCVGREGGREPHFGSRPGCGTQASQQGNQTEMKGHLVHPVPWVT